MNRQDIYIDGTALDTKYIKWGSYSVKKEARLIGSWVDGNGISHPSFFPNSKTTLTFTIIQRSPQTQEELDFLFCYSNMTGCSVCFYDEIECDYVTKTMRMTAPEVKQVINNDKVWYSETKITFTEN